MSLPRLHALSALIMLLLGMLCPAAPAQQQYRLDEADSWTSVDDAAEPGTPAAQVAQARRALAEGEFAKAISLSTSFIEAHRRHDLLPQAYLVRADAKLARGDDYKALFDYEYIARTAHGSDVWVTALERELEIAKEYARGKKRRLWGLRVINASGEAEELFIRVQERMPGSRLGEEASMELADFYFRRRDMTLAAESYDLFIENYPRSPLITKARRRLIYAHLASFKGPAFDASGLIEAAHRLRELQVLEPATAQEVGAEALLVRIDESVAAKLLENARWYVQTGDHISAELTIRRLVYRYPDSIATREALDLVVLILPLLPDRLREQAPDYEAIRRGAEDSTS